MASLLSTSPLPPATLLAAAAAAPTVKCTMTKLNCFTTMGGIRLVAKIQTSKASRSSLPISRCSKTSTVSCSPETLKIVQSTIAKQLSIEESKVSPDTKFADLGADSLDTVEIMMALEEKFEVSIGEDGAQNIATVQDAADLIEKVKADSA